MSPLIGHRIPRPPAPVKDISFGKEWTLTLAFHGSRSPIDAIGAFETCAAAQEEAGRQEGHQLEWQPPDPVYRGWMALGARGYWMVELTEKRPAIMRESVRKSTPKLPWWYRADEDR